MDAGYNRPEQARPASGLNVERNDGQNNSASTQGTERNDTYDIFVSQGIILAGSASDELKKGDIADPVTIVGDVMFDIATRIEAEGNRHGIKFDLGIMLMGANEIMGALLRMSNIKLNEEQKKAVIGHLIGRYLDDAVRSGKMTKEQVMALAKQAEAAQQGDQEGLLSSRMGGR